MRPALAVCLFEELMPGCRPAAAAADTGRPLLAGAGGRPRRAADIDGHATFCISNTIGRKSNNPTTIRESDRARGPIAAPRRPNGAPKIGY